MFGFPKIQTSVWVIDMCVYVYIKEIVKNNTYRCLVRGLYCFLLFEKIQDGINAKTRVLILVYNI
jgi:hypothetical protein